MRAIDVRDLLAKPGSATRSRVDEPLEGLRTEVVEVPADAPVAGDLLLENVVEGIVVSGTISAGMSLTCARCLRRYSEPVEVRVRELFTIDPDPDTDEYAYDADGGELDPEPMVRDAVGLAMPFAPLCRPDCKGLCERCGGDRNVGECGCGEVVDPRWAPLQDLL